MRILNRWYTDVVIFSFFFSIVFCFFCRLVDSLLGFWVFLELGGLSLVPSFFYCGNNRSFGIYGFYSSLLTYIIMSGLSSIMIISGLLFVGLYYFVFWGFAIKLGLFPFSLWVYRVFGESKWFFIFLLSVIMKFPVLFFCFLYQDCSLGLVYVDCVLTLLMCSLLLWFFRQDWEYVWCHISLSSVSTLIVACFCRDTSICFFIYFYYFFWSIFCVWYFYYSSEYGGFKNGFWVYCFLFLVTPISLPLFYKLSVCVGIVYSSFYVLFVWRIYRFSEQFYLYKMGGDFFYANVYNKWL